MATNLGLFKFDELIVTGEGVLVSPDSDLSGSGSVTNPTLTETFTVTLLDSNRLLRLDPSPRPTLAQVTAWSRQGEFRFDNGSVFNLAGAFEAGAWCTSGSDSSREVWTSFSGTWTTCSSVSVTDYRVKGEFYRNSASKRGRVELRVNGADADATTFWPTTLGLSNGDTAEYYT